MWLDSTNSQFLQANLQLMFVRTTNRPSRRVKKHKEQLCFYVIQSASSGTPVETQWQPFKQLVHTHISPNIRQEFFFIIHHLKNMVTLQSPT
jgi:hypothetical protein